MFWLIYNKLLIHSIDSQQKTAILGTSHIIRKVLQCEAWSLSGGDHRWFKRSTGKKRPVTRDDDNNNNIQHILSHSFFKGPFWKPIIWSRFKTLQCTYLNHTIYIQNWMNFVFQGSTVVPKLWRPKLYDYMKLPIIQPVCSSWGQWTARYPLATQLASCSFNHDNDAAVLDHAL